MNHFKIKTNVINLVKIILAICLTICFLKLPYGYYQFLRIAGTISFLFLAYQSRDNLIFKIIWIVSAILLNPIFKIYFTKPTWNIIDFILAFILIISIFIKSNIS